MVLCTGLLQASDAQALALGRMVVQSALGEPLRAEVDVLEITAEESASLRVGLAAAGAFRAAGMDFNAALADLQVVLQRRPDGRAFLRLTGSRPVNEPFMDMILEANWASGRIVRDYTLLFDPPNLRPPVPAPLAPAVTAQATPAPVTPPAVPSTAAVRPPEAASAPVARAPAAPASAAPDAGAGTASRVRVKTGDTAGRIAASHLPANVSLDQMLVAMLRANPDAFIGGNVNRIKAGSLVELPDETAAAATPSGEARQIIAAQSSDFNEFRRRLASRVPAAEVAAADRQAAGRVQAEVQDQKPAPATQDKLTLSKGAAAPGQSAPEAKIAEERRAGEASTRVAELSRNIEELNKIAPAAAPTAAAGSAPAAPDAPKPAAVTPEVVATPAAIPAPATPAAPVEPPAPPVAQTPAPAPAPKPAAPMPVPAVDEPSFMEQLLGNPFVLPAAGGLLALLAGLGLYRMRQRKKTSAADSSFLESRLQPDSFFGSSGGQRIDTAEASASGSSMVYSPSQLDAAGDVDPVAEADVYLAYGRDLQAEEILKEAMRSTPTRVAIHNKLLEIYAKRRDTKAFEVVATEAYGLTQGQGAEWEHACGLGKELDPNNPLYQPGGSPAAKPGAVVTGSANTIPFGNSTLSQHTTPGAPIGAEADADLGLDLDLDIGLDEPSAPAALQMPAPVEAQMSSLDDLAQTEALTSAPGEVSDMASRPMDFDLDFPSEPVPLSSSAPTAKTVDGSAEQPTFDDSEVLPAFDFDEPSSPSVQSSNGQDHGTSTANPPTAELLSFDLSDIELELSEPEPAKGDEPSRLSAENPLETKLSLAEEFRAIGDLEGARSLAEEVLAEASGTLRTKAGTFLADLA
ncbi:FimV/HubP family polar landmark protein [Hydrogenophaga sp. ZJX-1]|uniref:FimV/HubP family polar landmark protein n=1 Tax=Hydrogenophaga sp. ZJX-1 TaxID=3404778 RepID=UPI003B27EA21